MTPQAMFDQMVAEGDVVLDRLHHLAETTPDKCFVYYGEEDRSISFAEFRANCARLAAGFQRLGIAPDDRVSVYSRNALLAIEVMFAAWMCGAVYAPLNFFFRGKLLAYQLNDSQPKMLVTDVGHVEHLEAIADEYRSPQLVVHAPRPGDHDHEPRHAIPAAMRCAARILSLEDVVAAEAAFIPVPRHFHDCASIIYTSGTTGPSKGVMLPFRWINQYSFGYRKLFNADDVIYSDLPMYHVGGAFFRVTKALYLGATVAVYDRFSPNEFWQRIRRSGATHATLLDVMVPWLMAAAPGSTDRDHTISKVHMQPLPLHHNAVAQRFGIDVVTAGFGQTETGGSFTSIIDEFPGAEAKRADWRRGLAKADLIDAGRAYGMMIVDGTKPLQKGFMGVPSSLFEARIVDESDRKLPRGQTGQLLLRPRYPSMFLKTYLNKPEAMAKAMANFWFHTGDACYRDDAGVFHFVDRMNGFFRVRGENVSSHQIEDLLNDHPEVRSSAVVPVPAAEGNEEECAVFIERLPDSRLDEEGLLAFARQAMPRYMVPAHVRFIDRLPVTGTNKVEKYKLRTMLLDELGRVA